MLVGVDIWTDEVSVFVSRHAVTLNHKKKPNPKLSGTKWSDKKRDEILILWNTWELKVKILLYFSRSEKKLPTHDDMAENAGTE